MSSLRTELDRLKRAARSVDVRTATVLLYAALAVILQMKIGDRGMFRRDIAPILGVETIGVAPWVWWFGVQGVLGFLIPFGLLRGVFGLKASEAGLGRGDVRFALKIAAIYLPLVLVGTWILSDQASFLEDYPHHGPAATDWSVFLVYEAFFLFYWVGWEYLWRGFVLFGTKHVFGIYAIFVQTMPFAIMHYDKPTPEALLSIVGGVAIGALVWRARSFWIAVPIHAAQMLMLDFWCSMRIRTGTEGIGPGALFDVLGM
ncbi:MAG: CPBP family intramembrane metalloprotease [Rhodothermales bacterium]|nr:CPBP family intramembrane metalloprotease [Rhodothermales bacterium]